MAQRQMNNLIPEELIAPCGINCAVCSRYLAYQHNFRHSQCAGCRASNKNCTYLFAKCAQTNNVTTQTREFCFQCEHYPCKQLKRVDARYRESYQVSTIENLENIRQYGTSYFIEEQNEKHRCVRCGGMISMHNRKCFACDAVTRLIEKRDGEAGE